MSDDITAGWSLPKMKAALLEMLGYLPDDVIEDHIEIYKGELERRYEIRRKDPLLFPDVRSIDLTKHIPKSIHD